MVVLESKSERSRRLPSRIVARGMMRMRIPSIIMYIGSWLL